MRRLRLFTRVSRQSVDSQLLRTPEGRIYGTKTRCEPLHQLDGVMEIRATIFDGVDRESVAGGSSESLEAVLQSHRRQRIAAAASHPSMCSKMHTDPLHSDAKAFF
jgi:hypothetical protein